MEIFIAMGVFFIVTTAIFVAVAVFLPEWVGITGARAKEIMREQQGDSLDSIHQESPQNPAEALTLEATTPPTTSNPSQSLPADPALSPNKDKPHRQ